MTNLMEIDEALHRNGIISERARRAGQSLTRIERQIIYANRRAAALAGLNVRMINFVEMEGQTDKDIVNKPIKVVAKFAYYSSPEIASYLIVESNCPSLPVHGNVEAQQLIDAGIPVPKTPSYESWEKNGRKCFRG